MPLPSNRTLAEVQEWFFNEGMAVTTWSREHGFRPEVVYALLSGRTKGRRGDAHRAALALGLKKSHSSAKDAGAAESFPATARTSIQVETPMPTR